MNQLNIRLDGNGKPTGGINFSENISSITMAADTIYHLQVPKDATIAIFSFIAASGVFVKLDATADAEFSLPGAEWVSNGLELSPAVRNVSTGMWLHFRSAQAAEVSVSFFKV